MVDTPLADISVVLAEDHVDSAELLEMLLERSGAKVRVCHTGASTLELLATFKPDVLLLDITLPDMDGYELLAAIRALPGLAKTPAVAVTGHAFERDRQRALETGFAVHTTKPIDIEALVHLIAGLVAPPAPAAPMPAAEDLRAMLEAKGIVEVLRVLNARMPHRYTALYQYDGPTLRSVALVDSLEPSVTKGGDVPVETSFCWLVERDRASFVTEDSAADPRVVGLPVREDVKAYCGTLLRNADGTPFGSLCHFDHEPQAVPAGELALLERFAPMLAQVVAVDIF